MHPHNSKIQGCDGEKYWNADTIHHSNERDNQNIAVFSMDDKLGSNIKIDILIDMSCLSSIVRFWIPLEFLVQFPHEPLNKITLRLEIYMNECVNDHSLRNSVSNDSVPQRNEVIEGSIKDPFELWGHVLEVSIHK